MRWALVLALLVTPALAAPPDVIGQFNWLWAQKPKAGAAVPVPVPAPQSRAKPEAVQPATPESPKAAPKARPPKTAKPKPKVAKPKVEQPSPSGGGQALPPSSGITCAEARQGVGMPCFLIRQNAWRYERLSLAEKRHADSCLSAAEREVIRACFR